MILKTLKLGIFSLLAVLAISVFLTSCEQEQILTDTINEQQIDVTPLNLNEEEAVHYLLPWGYGEEFGRESETEYMASIDDETFVKLIENRKIAYYFVARLWTFGELGL